MSDDKKSDTEIHPGRRYSALVRTLIHVKTSLSQVGVERYEKKMFDVRKDENIGQAVERLCMQYADTCVDLSNFANKNREQAKEIERLQETVESLRRSLAKKQPRKTG